MKLDTRWALPIYLVLKAQSHENRCENILQKFKKYRAPIQSNSWIVKNRSAIIAGWEDEGGY